MAKMGKGMAERIDEGGHYVASSMGRLKKGDFQQVGSGIGEGDMMTVTPGATSVNSKTGTTQTGENG